MELKQQILEGTIAVYRRRGFRFTMDDLAKELGMSKKTIYTVFRDKKQLFLAMVDYLFDAIKEEEKRIMESTGYTTVEKLRSILAVLPECYKDLDLTQLYQLKERYPNAYKQVEMRLETGWESTISLIEQGIAEGVLRPVPIPLFKLMLEATLEQFFRQDILVRSGMTYDRALSQVVDILMDGITVQKQEVLA